MADWSIKIDFAIPYRIYRRLLYIAFIQRNKASGRVKDGTLVGE
jgi:hypothetical protein